MSRLNKLSKNIITSISATQKAEMVTLMSAAIYLDVRYEENFQELIA